MEPGKGIDNDPTDDFEAKQIIDRIRRNTGDIDAADDLELQKTKPEFQDGYRRKEAERRGILVNSTKK